MCTLSVILARLTAGLLTCCFLAGATASTDSDVMWQKLVSIRSEANPGEGRLEKFRHTESKALRYREAGVEFFRKYPDDPRRWEWLRNAVMTSPWYARDAVQATDAFARRAPWEVMVDEEAKLRWDRIFETELKPALAAAKRLPGSLRLPVYWEDFLQRSERDGNYRARRGETVDVTLLQKAVLDFGAVFPQEAETAGMFAGRYLLHMEDWGVSDQANRLFMAALQASPNATLRANGALWGQVLKLKEEPLDLRLETLDGKVIEVSTLRGRVVLLDFWATTCGACIEAMPRIKAIHERYRGNGFEVIGIALNEPRERRAVERVLEKTGVHWPQSLNGRSSDLQKRFPFPYVPITFLLDRTGRLVTTDIDSAEGPRLEQQVRRLLGLQD